MTTSKSDRNLFNRLLAAFSIILVGGLLIISSVNQTGNKVAHNMDMLVTHQLPQLDAIHALQTNIKKLELELYRYYETTDRQEYQTVWNQYQSEMTQFLTKLDDSFVSIFMGNLTRLDTIANQFDQEMNYASTDWELLRAYLVEARQISKQFDVIVKQEDQNIAKAFKSYVGDTEDVISTMVSAQIIFSVFILVILLIVAILFKKQLKQHAVHQELALYPEQNPHPILKLDTEGNALYLNPAAISLATSLNCISTPLKLLPATILTDINRQSDQGSSYKSAEYPLAQQLFSAQVHRNQGEDYFYAYLEDITDRAEAEKELVHRSTHDLLTQLPNRRQLEDTLKLKTEHAIKNPFAVLLFNVSRLELINASLGHEISDQLLIAISHRLQAYVVQYSAHDLQLYAFESRGWVIVCDHCDQQAEVTALGHELMALFSTPISLGKAEFNISANIGITLYPEGGKTSQDLLRNTDAAMRQGFRDSQAVRLYTQDLTEQASHWLRLEQGLKQALTNNDFLVYIQPKVHANNGHFAGGEALIRWQFEGQWISPAEFIPVAEESGLIHAIGEWVLNTACQQWVDWSKEGLKPKRLAVNVSVQQFVQDDFIDIIKQSLQSTGMVATELELEITEEVASQDPEKIIHTMKGLKELGVRLAIDDFGTGYSSLAYLRRFPVDTLKIDRAFVGTMEVNENNAAIVRMIMSLAKELKLEVVAEGVENKQQQLLLAHLDCDLIQGFYFHKPMDFAAYGELLAQQ
ncbi:MAG: hypothetical protein COA90_09025 [Gammaproteobacteria bacterium]|nr:MAG: hypothetical protein COA90_09025 [Gammaproteobacteria bacterium]